MLNYKKIFYIKYFFIILKLNYNNSNLFLNIKKIFIYYSINRNYIKNLLKNIFLIFKNKLYCYNIFIYINEKFLKNRYFNIYKFKNKFIYIKLFFLFCKILFLLK